MRFPMQALLGAYARLLIFAAGLLLGIQVPAFVIQYSQRVDAHFREVSANIAGFQATADELFAGNLDDLIAYYRRSPDPVFSRDATGLDNLVGRFRRISAEQQALEGNALAVALHVLLAADPELRREALNQYSYTVPLNGIALQWGLGLAVLAMVMLDLAWFGCRRCGRWLRGKGQGTGQGDDQGKGQDKGQDKGQEEEQGAGFD